MQVKVFEAPDMATGLSMVRKELGADALILSTKTVKSGKFGLTGKQYLEITAAIDNDINTPAPQLSTVKPSSFARRNAHHAYTHNSGQDNSAGKEPSEAPSPRQPSPAENLSERELLTAQSPEPPSFHAEDGALRNEVDELKEIVRNLTGEIQKVRSTTPTAPKTPTAPFQYLENKLLSTRKGGTVEDLLLRHGINQESSKIIAGFAAEQLTEKDMNSCEALLPFLHSTLSTIIKVNPFELQNSSAQKRIALVGPTGVGKTTTIAKLAARHLATISKSVALITIDTYRIAAVEQLKVYGEIMHLPVEVVITPEQLQEAFERHSDKDCILIDTAGRSHLDDMSINELQTFLDPAFAIDTHLVLSATTRDEEIDSAITRFSSCGVRSIIFTKIDECTRLGVLLNAQVREGTPISLVTNGQRVPEDILDIDPVSLAQLIIPTLTVDRI